MPSALPLGLLDVSSWAVWLYMAAPSALPLELLDVSLWAVELYMSVRSALLLWLLGVESDSLASAVSTALA